MTEKHKSPFLELKNIVKRFNNTIALKDVSLKFYLGSVHVLVGENGAGKSTLMKIINGLYPQDSGEMFLNGAPYNPQSPLEARQSEIAMIYQELNYVEELTVAENIFLGREKLNYGFTLDNKSMVRETRRLLEEEGLKLDPNEKMKNLSVAEAQLIEIVKAISGEAKLILMDEPTSAITEKEVEYLFQQITKLKKGNKAIVYISHKMDEIYQIADEISVLRDGEKITTKPADQINPQELINLMVGREVNTMFPEKNHDIGKVVLDVKNLSSNKLFNNINFSLREGEVLGMAGLMGAGRSEIAESIFGLRNFDSGQIDVGDKAFTSMNVQSAIDLNIGMVTEDRRKYGFFGVRNVEENINISSLNKSSFVLQMKKLLEKANFHVNNLNIKTSSLFSNVDFLSGGNQQKVVLAKWLETKPKILILDEPTRGIDVGAKQEIYHIINSLSKSGIAILLISSELPELIGLSDRILVMREGNLVKELNAQNTNQVEIMKYATGGNDEN